MSVLTLTDRPLGEQIEVLERGLPSSALAEIAAALGLPKARIIKALKLVLRTMTESPRLSRRLHHLREWSHGKYVKEIFS